MEQNLPMATLEVKFVSRIPPAAGFDIYRVADGTKVQASELDTMTARGDAVVIRSKDGAKLWKPRKPPTPTAAIPGCSFTSEDRDQITGLEDKFMELDVFLRRMALGIDMLLQQHGMAFPELPKPASLDEPAEEC